MIFRKAISTQHDWNHLISPIYDYRPEVLSLENIQVGDEIIVEREGELNYLTSSVTGNTWYKCIDGGQAYTYQGYPLGVVFDEGYGGIKGTVLCLICTEITPLYPKFWVVKKLGNRKYN